MPELADDTLKVTEEFEVPEDAKPEETIQSVVQSETMRENSVLALTIEVPIAEYNKRLGNALKQLRKSAVLPGFRKGKAPEALLRKRFGKQMEEDAVREIAPGVFNQYALEKKLRLASEATMEDHHVDDEKGLVIDYVAEIIPDLELKEYSGLKIEAPYEEDETSAFDREVERLRNMFAERRPLEDGELTADSAATLNINVRDERGKSIKGAAVGRRFLARLAAALPEPVVEALKGKKAGDSVEVEVAKERQGVHGNVYSTKDIFQIEVVEVSEWVYPEINDDWLREHLEVEGGVAEYRERLEKMEAEERADNKKSAALFALYEKLAELNPVDPPRSFIQRRFLALAESEMRRLSMYYRRRVNLSERAQEMLWAAAEFDIKRSFISEAVAKKEAIEVAESDVEAEIAKRAEEQGRKPLAVRAELERHKKLDDLREGLKRQKVDEFLMEKNEVAYVAPKEDEPEAEEAKKEEGETS